MIRASSNNQFVGQQLIYYPACASTNTVAMQLVHENKLQEGSVVITDHQTAGRGQRDNHWEAAPGQNLTFSVVFYPGLPVSLQFYLNIIASLAVTDALYFSISKLFKVKWPNDILYLNNKLCGILIQNNLKGNKIQSVVMGIGINVNQNQFSYSQASSLSLITGKKIEREEILSEVLGFLEKRYNQLADRDLSELKSDYLERLYRLDETHYFADQDGEFEGRIRGIDENGCLLVWAKGEMRSYNFKEVRYIE